MTTMMLRLMLVAIVIFNDVNGVFGQVVQPDAYRTIVSSFPASSIATDCYGKLYFADMSNARIVTSNISGNILNQSAADFPTNVAVYAATNAVYYISNSTSQPVRILNGVAQSFGPRRYAAKAIAVLESSGYVVVAEAHMVHIIGRLNSSVSIWPFDSCAIAKIAVSDKDNVLYIACLNSSLVVKCSLNGAFINNYQYDGIVKTIAVDPLSGDVVLSGATNNMFSRYRTYNWTLNNTFAAQVPSFRHVATAIDFAGNLFLAESLSDQLYKYNINGAQPVSIMIVSALPSFTQFTFYSLTLDSSGGLYLCDRSINNRVLRFTAELTFSRAIRTGDDVRYAAIDGADNLYFTSPTKYALIQCDTYGNNSKSITNRTFTPATIAASTSSVYVFGSTSSADWRLFKYSSTALTYVDVTPSKDILPLKTFPLLAMDRAQNVYISSTADTSVVQFNSNMQTTSIRYETRLQISAITVDSVGYVYVANTLSSMALVVNVFSNDGKLLSTIAAPKVGPGLIIPAIAVDLPRRVLYCGYTSTRVLVLPLPPALALSSSSALPRISSTSPSSLSPSNPPAPSSTASSSSSSSSSLAVSSLSSPSSSLNLSSSTSVMPIPSSNTDDIASFWATLWWAIIIGASTLCCLVIVIGSVIGCLVYRQRAQRRASSDNMKPSAIDMRVYMPPPPRQVYPVMQQSLLDNHYHNNAQ